jgi:hypothetical protein
MVLTLLMGIPTANLSWNDVDTDDGHSVDQRVTSKELPFHLMIPSMTSRLDAKGMAMEILGEKREVRKSQIAFTALMGKYLVLIRRAMLLLLLLMVMLSSNDSFPCKTAPVQFPGLQS